MSLINRRFGSLIVLDEFKRGKGPARVLVRCDCGVEKETCSRSVVRGRSRSCGCLQRATATRHGLSNHPEYTRWRGMIDRCYRPDNQSYVDYGAKGVAVCDEWRSTPEAFIAWADANGASPEKQLDRIDNSLGYSPDNCRFVSVRDNQRNRRSNCVISVAGESMTIADAAERFGIPYDTLRQRLRKLNWAVERALSDSVRRREAGHAQAAAQ